VGKEDAWYWADYDGSAIRSTAERLRNEIRAFRLPPFVLVWHTGWSDWVPAYLVDTIYDDPDLERGVNALALEGGGDEPPSPPIEWYTECLGKPPKWSLLTRERQNHQPSLELDWNETFSVHERPTARDRRTALPLAAFRQVDDYLAHIRAIRNRT
jgi:hypothetical protein